MLKLADRMAKLGTETAFVVSADAAVFAEKGHKVYPFHLGDLNIPTPKIIVDAAFKAIRDGKTGYCPNSGIPQLRDLLAHTINAARNTHYSMENVVIQPGGKPVIGKFIMAMMNPGDEVLYPDPGYPIYESQIEFNGGRAVPYPYYEGKNNYQFDLGDIVKNITPKTRLLILNNPQNPLGADCQPDELERLAELVLRHELYVLCDEAYFDMRYQGRSHSLASLPGMEERCVILYTFSKKFAMTGWRLGAAVGPEKIATAIGKINVNDESCSNHFIQYAVMAGLTGDQSEVKNILNILRERRDVAVDILNSIEGITCFRPDATFYLFPNVTGLMQRKGFDQYETFRKTVLQETGVSFCTRLHFGRPLPSEKNCYIRLAYSGIDTDQIQEGLLKFKNWTEK